MQPLLTQCSSIDKRVFNFLFKPIDRILCRKPIFARASGKVRISETHNRKAHCILFFHSLASVVHGLSDADPGVSNKAISGNVCFRKNIGRIYDGRKSNKVSVSRSIFSRVIARYQNAEEPWRSMIIVQNKHVISIATCLSTLELRLAGPNIRKFRR